MEAEFALRRRVTSVMVSYVGSPSMGGMTGWGKLSIKASMEVAAMLVLVVELEEPWRRWPNFLTNYKEKSTYLGPTSFSRWTKRPRDSTIKDKKRFILSG
jgi:hypothetical protein